VAQAERDKTRLGSSTKSAFLFFTKFLPGKKITALSAV
jgi:hypothetical protein